MGEKFKSIREATHEIPVSREFDVNRRRRRDRRNRRRDSGSRAGAKTLLLERYGYLEGDRNRFPIGVSSPLRSNSFSSQAAAFQALMKRTRRTG